MKGKTALITASSQTVNRKIVLAKNVVLILSFAALTGISAGLKIEIGPIPVTMQTLIVLLSGVLLGAKKGAMSQITYLLAGLIGLPWFSRGGGIIYIMSPTFGYILGFVITAYLIGLLFEKGWDKNIKKSIMAIIIANFAMYIPGLLWLAKFVELSKILIIGLYPFIIGDILKIFLVMLIFSFNSKSEPLLTQRRRR